jgi:2-pyrone-4,6-dicarboxylate lactonase
MTDAPAPTYHPSPSRPKLRVPPGAWDTHCHVFGPQKTFPFASGHSRRADAPKERLFAVHAHLGFEQSVIVHSAVHGFDMRATEDALQTKAGTYRGIALLPVTVGDAELRRLDALGFSGVRFHFVKHLERPASIDEVVAFGSRLADLGWHLEIHLEPATLADLAPALARSPVHTVVDHMARVDASLGLAQAAFQHLLRLMGNNRIWVKVSGCDRITRTGPPYADAVPFARKLVAEFPERVVWGTDWPHPNHAGPIPDDGQLVDLIEQIAPTERQRKLLLVDNPRRLYARRPS